MNAAFNHNSRNIVTKNEWLKLFDDYNIREHGKDYYTVLEVMQAMSHFADVAKQGEATDYNKIVRQSNGIRKLRFE